jgi:SAM-dependent methyltransferase
MNVEQSVRQRYSAAAQAAKPELCCPIDYDLARLKLLPPEIIEKDYGCCDPSRYARAGDVVLDLGSGGGKVCYLAAQIVGSSGRVIGVDMNDDMLALARKYQAEMAQRLGSDRVRFLKGYIQDLALDIAATHGGVRAHVPVFRRGAVQERFHRHHAGGTARPAGDLVSAGRHPAPGGGNEGRLLRDNLWRRGLLLGLGRAL